MLLVLWAAFFAGCGGTQNVQSSKNDPVPNGSGVTIKMLDIGQGDSILVRTASQATLIDTGDIPEKGRLVKLLQKENIAVIDHLIITHPHADHLGGAAAVLENFTVKNVYDNGQATTTATYRNYIKMVAKKKIKHQVLRGGDQLDLGGGASLRIVGPIRIEKGRDLNDGSIVARLSFGDFSMLFTGDAEREEEHDILAQYGAKLKSTILKSGHHGSRTSSTAAFLKAVAPEAALISCGRDNDYGHPHKVILNRYNAAKIKVYRTDRDGTITVTTDGKDYKITKEK